MATGDYLDLRQECYRDAWSAALDYGAYLAASEEKHRVRWQAALERTALTEAQRHLLGSFTRQLRLLVLSGVWCGDCVRQGPIYQRIAEAAPSLELRFLEREEHPELRDMLRINGAKKVPVALFLSEDFYTIGCFGDRTLTYYRAKAKRDLGDTCETGLVPPEPEALAAEVAEWVDICEWQHLIVRCSPMLRERHGD